ncbi:MAG: hypothetical protein MZW92_66330 [Comamonadaceae bacterium]|nr:hypothetical protein [Comamonadaceae bacterium]
MRVLAYPKFRLTAAEQQEFLADYLPYCTAVRVPAKSPQMPVCQRSVRCALPGTRGGRQRGLPRRR